METAIARMHALGAIKFGSFEIKKGLQAPFQIDLKGLISHPEIAKHICDLYWEKAKNLTFDLLCGTPLTGACFANYMAWNRNIPLVCLNSSGFVEGMYKTNQRCLLIQDIFLSDADTLEAIEHLENGGLIVHDILASMDLELKAKKKIKRRGFIPHELIPISKALNILFEADKIPGDRFKLVNDFLENEKIDATKPKAR